MLNPGESLNKSIAYALSETISKYLTVGVAFLRVAAEHSNQLLQLIGRGVDAPAVGAADHQRHAEIGAAEIGVGADFEIAVAVLQRAEVFRQQAFAERAADAPAQHLIAAAQPVFQF